jgi:hypothetical protein
MKMSQDTTCVAILNKQNVIVIFFFFKIKKWEGKMGPSCGGWGWILPVGEKKRWGEVVRG